MGDEYQYNTFSIDQHFNEDEPQSKLTDIILEVETYFEKNKTIDGEKYQLQKWEKIREDSDGKKWKKIVVVRRFPDILPCVWFKIQDVFEDDINVFHKETTTNEEEELPDLKKLWEENFQEESFIH